MKNYFSSHIVQWKHFQSFQFFNNLTFDPKFYFTYFLNIYKFKRWETVARINRGDEKYLFVLILTIKIIYFDINMFIVK